MTSPGSAITTTSHDRLVDLLLWALTFASAGLTLWLSLGPVPPGASAFPTADKASHGVAYFVTTLLFLFAAVWRPGRGRVRSRGSPPSCWSPWSARVCSSSTYRGR